MAETAPADASVSAPLPAAADVLAVIPARGGSAGVPRKNVRRVGGRPLLAWTVEAAREARTVGRVAVSTDDDEIADVARTVGAEVIERPAALSGDEASSEGALLHALEHLEAAEGYAPEVLVFLQCTAPLTQPADIDATVAALVEQGADAAFAAAPWHGFLWERGADGTATARGHEAGRRLRRQDRAPQFVEAGSVYAVRVEGFREARHRFFGKTVLHEIPAARRLEIDTPADLARADALLRARSAEPAAATVPPFPEPLKAVVFDFDGVFTDNKVIVFPDEKREAVRCDRRDGHGIGRLRRAFEEQAAGGQEATPMLILSSEVHPVVRARAGKLDLDVIHGVKDKEAVLDDWLRTRGLDWAGVVFVGNDLNDRACVARAGCGVAVADAYPPIHAAADFSLKRRGGEGAVRELCDLLLAHLSPVSLS